MGEGDENIFVERDTEHPTKERETERKSTKKL